MTRNIDPPIGQLTFDDMHLRLLARGLPQQLPPIMQWRKLLRRVEPPEDAKCSVRSFRAVATVLADYANRNGRSCFPSVERIARESGYSERSVQYALAALELRGLVRRQKVGGRGRTTRYVLHVPGAVEIPGGNVETQGAKGASDDTERVQCVAPEVLHLEDRQVAPLTDASVVDELPAVAQSRR